MLDWLRRKGELPGWFASTLDAEVLDFAHAQRAASGKWAITRYGSRPLGAERRNLATVAHALGLQRYRCSTMLRPGEYQFLLVEGLDVPRDDLRQAFR